MVGSGQETAFVIGSHIYYPRTFSKELEKQFTFVYMGHRGFSPKQDAMEEDFALEKLLYDIEYLRKKLNLEKITLIGHSIHALIAIEYAKKYPYATNRLVLIASSPISGSELFQEANRYFEESVCPTRKILLQKNMQTLDEDISKDPNSTFITRMLKFAPMIWYNPSFDASHLWEGVKIDPIGGNKIWNGIFLNYQLPKIATPTLLMLGRYDYWNPPYLWEKFRHYFQNLTIRVFEASGHTPQLEEPENFNQELLSWVD